MQALQTKCGNCNKPLPLEKVEHSEWPVYCSPECTEQADLKIRREFEARFN